MNATATFIGPLAAAQLEINNDPELIQDAIYAANVAAQQQRAASLHCSNQLDVDAFWQSFSAVLCADTACGTSAIKTLKQLQRTFSRISIHLAADISDHDEWSAS